MEDFWGWKNISFIFGSYLKSSTKWTYWTSWRTQSLSYEFCLGFIAWPHFLLEGQDLRKFLFIYESIWGVKFSSISYSTHTRSYSNSGPPIILFRLKFLFCAPERTWGEPPLSILSRPFGLQLINPLPFVSNSLHPLAAPRNYFLFYILLFLIPFIFCPRFRCTLLSVVRHFPPSW